MTDTNRPPSTSTPATTPATAPTKTASAARTPGIRDSWRAITRRGLWDSNPALVQLLGLCPLLAVSNSAINGLSLGLATLLVLTLSNTLISAVRHWLPAVVRMPLYVLLIATLVTVVELLLHAWSNRLYGALGIFIPLIVTNCLLMARAESVAARQPVAHAALDGFMHGLGFLLVLFVLGSLREVLGAGSWLAGAEQLFGPAASALTLQISAVPPLLLALLPPGAFVLLGLLVALRNGIANRRKADQN